MNLTESNAATGGVLWKDVFLNISQNSQENTCVRASFLIVFVKKETPVQVFTVNVTKFFRTAPVDTSRICQMLFCYSHNVSL